MSNSNQPLAGRTIVITRPRAQSSELCGHLENLGARVVTFPTIKIVPPQDSAPLREALRRIDVYDWVVFTSRNAVDALAKELGNEIPEALSRAQIAVVGKATAQCLQALGVIPDLIPSKSNVARLCKDMVERVSLTGKRIFYPCSNLVQPESVQPLREAGAQVETVVAYSTVADDSADITGLQKLLAAGEVDAVIFASPSAAGSFFERIPPEHLPPSILVLSIGPTTTAALRQIPPAQIRQASQSDTQGLVDVLVREWDSTY